MFLLDTNAVSESRKLATSNVDPVFKNWIELTKLIQICFMYRSSV